MEKEIVMTYAGLRAIEEELEMLKTVKRKEVAEKIKVARVGRKDSGVNKELFPSGVKAGNGLRRSPRGKYGSDHLRLHLVPLLS